MNTRMASTFREVFLSATPDQATSQEPPSLPTCSSLGKALLQPPPVPATVARRAAARIGACVTTARAQTLAVLLARASLFSSDSASEASEVAALLREAAESVEAAAAADDAACLVSLGLCHLILAGMGSADLGAARIDKSIALLSRGITAAPTGPWASDARLARACARDDYEAVIADLSAVLGASADGGQHASGDGRVFVAAYNSLHTLRSAAGAQALAELFPERAPDEDGPLVVAYRAPTREIPIPLARAAGTLGDVWPVLLKLARVRGTTSAADAAAALRDVLVHHRRDAARVGVAAADLRLDHAAQLVDGGAPEEAIVACALPLRAGSAREARAVALRARALAAAGRWDEAAAAAPDSSVLAGVCKGAVGDWTGACAALEAACAEDETDALAAYNLALARAALGDLPGAAAGWRAFRGSQRPSTHGEGESALDEATMAALDVALA